MVLLLASSLAVVVGSLAVSAALPRRGAFAFLLAALLLCAAAIDVIVLVAGAVLGSLSPATLAMLALGWMTIALLAARGSVAPGSLAERLGGSLRLLGAALQWPPAAIAAALITVMLAWRTVLAIRLPVVDVLGWQYHLVSVDVWLQSNALVRVAQNPWTDGWPAGGELLTAWLAAFTRTDALTGFTSLLAVPVAMVAVSGLARAFGAGRRTSLLAGLLFGMVPALIALSGTTYPDTGTTAAVVAAWWLGLRILRGERDPAACLLFGIAAGLAVGSKGTSILLLAPMLAAVWVLLLVVLVRAARVRADVTGAVASIAVLAIPLLVLGASWYLKNAIVHGNPVYPVAVGPFQGPIRAGAFGAPPVPGALAGHGPIEQTLRSWVADWRLTRYAYNQRPGGFGLAWLGVIALAVGGITALARRRDWAALGLVIAPALVTMALMTSPWYARYTLFIPGVALPLAAVTLERVRPRARSLLGLVLVGLASVSLVVANASPNVSLPLPRTPVARALGYLELVLTAPESARSDVDLRRTCAGLRVIDAGDRVAVVTSFMVPHAVVGPDLDRILTAPMPGVRTTEALVAGMDARDARWLVTLAGTPTDKLAAAGPDHFVSYGPVCKGGTLWRFVPPP